MESEHGGPAREAAPGGQEGWNLPLPADLPRRTLWPVAAAFGTVLVFWAIVTSYLVLVIGLGLLVFSAVGWINEIRREGTPHD